MYHWKKLIADLWHRLRTIQASEPEATQTSTSRVARKLDFYGFRLTMFLLVIIILSQLNFSIYQSVVLAILGTLLWHCYLQKLPRQRLTKLARLRLQQLHAKEADPITIGQPGLGGKELVNRLFTVKGIRGLFSSGAFLIVFGLFFDQWLRMYFVSFGLINILLAGWVYLRLTNAKDIPLVDAGPAEAGNEEKSCENLIPPVK